MRQSLKLIAGLFTAATIIALLVLAGRAAHPLNQKNTAARTISTTEANSLWVVVNKQHPLDPLQYAPAHLAVPDISLRANITDEEKLVNSNMKPDLERMVAAALTEGIHINLQSGYRSYAFQVNLYNEYVKASGQTNADKDSARPGYSEHQTGLAADLGGTIEPSCNVAVCFASTPEGKWLAAHAYEYGFIVRYQANKEAITGYEYEPWHVRYIGTQLSQEMHRRGITTLEEFFNISGGVKYK